MSAGSSKAQINVTPMIDVLLVLIIIFMVITPIAPRGLNAVIPQEAKDTLPDPAPSTDLVISVSKGDAYSINQEPVPADELQKRLEAIFRIGSSRHVFVRGDRDLEFQAVVRVIDAARNAGWDRVGLMTK